MNCHDLLNKLNVVYGHAYDLKKKAIEAEHKYPALEDAIAEMQDTLYRIDRLAKKVTEQLNNGG